MIVARGKGFSITRSDLDKAITTGKSYPRRSRQPHGSIRSAGSGGTNVEPYDHHHALEQGERRAEEKIPEVGRTLAEMQQQHPSLESFERQLMTSGTTLDYLKQQIRTSHRQNRDR